MWLVWLWNFDLVVSCWAFEVPCTILVVVTWTLQTTMLSQWFISFLCLAENDPNREMASRKLLALRWSRLHRSYSSTSFSDTGPPRRSNRKDPRWIRSAKTLIHWSQPWRQRLFYWSWSHFQNHNTHGSSRRQIRWSWLWCFIPEIIHASFGYRRLVSLNVKLGFYYSALYSLYFTISHCPLIVLGA